MTTTMHEPFTAGPARKGIANRRLVPACAVLLVTAAALLAGKDDIRKFHRMRSM